MKIEFVNLGAACAIMTGLTSFSILWFLFQQLTDYNWSSEIRFLVYFILSFNSVLYVLCCFPFLFVNVFFSILFFSIELDLFLVSNYCLYVLLSFTQRFQLILIFFSLCSFLSLERSLSIYLSLPLWFRLNFPLRTLNQRRPKTEPILALRFRDVRVPGVPAPVPPDLR